ncbi:MAG: class I SAM-dependent methyltransferase [Sinomicrobium sp.]|nr:class I SAM-dependent methyltransferase [Sinomicrobium sp.]
MLAAASVTAQYIERDWEARDRWMNIPGLFALAGITTGSTVADIGCHEGYLTVHMARKVGPEGKVYAVDINENRLKKLDEHLQERNLINVETVLGDYDNPKLPEGALDVVVIMDTYHEMTEYMTVLKHVKNALKSGGRIVLVEKMKSHMRNKSRKQQTEAHTLAMQYVKKELEAAGFSVSKTVDDFGKWENEPGKKIWLLIATPDNTAN